MISEHEKQSIAASYKEEGFLEGMEKGMEKGIEQGIEKVAKALKDKGIISIADICEITGLDERTVASL